MKRRQKKRSSRTKDAMNTGPVLRKKLGAGEKRKRCGTAMGKRTEIRYSRQEMSTEVLGAPVRKSDTRTKLGMVGLSTNHEWGETGVGGEGGVEGKKKVKRKRTQDPKTGRTSLKNRRVET